MHKSTLTLHLSNSDAYNFLRFSKLFMAHLDSEFQKQANPTLKSLVADQVGAISQVDDTQRYLLCLSFKANKYIPLFAPSVTTVLSVRANFSS